MRTLVSLVAVVALVGCAEMPPRPPLDGQVDKVTQRDVREITAEAKRALAQSGRGTEAVYSVQIERADYAYAWFGKRRVHYDDTEQAIVVEKVKGHWCVPSGLRELVSGSNIPTG